MNNENANANEMAFPVAASWSDMEPQILTRQGGLTKREYFAAMAMQGILSNSPDWDDSDSNKTYVSIMSVGFADELLKQLSNEVNS